MKSAIAGAIVGSVITWVLCSTQTISIDASNVVCMDPPLIQYYVSGVSKKVCELKPSGLLILVDAHAENKARKL